MHSRNSLQHPSHIVLSLRHAQQVRCNNTTSTGYVQTFILFILSYLWRFMPSFELDKKDTMKRKLDDQIHSCFTNHHSIMFLKVYSIWESTSSTMLTNGGADELCVRSGISSHFLLQKPVQRAGAVSHSAHTNIFPCTNMFPFKEYLSPLRRQ